MTFKENLKINIEKYTDLKVPCTNFSTGISTFTDYKVPCYNSGFNNNSASGTGKSTPSEIINYILSQDINWVGNNSNSQILKSSADIQNNMSTFTHIANTGIDCNGLVYYVANESSNGAVKQYFLTETNLSNAQLAYASGLHIRYYLCSESYGSKKTKAKDILPGCFIYFDNYGHIAIVYDVEKNSQGIVTKIRFTHSQIGGSGSVTVNNLCYGGPSKGYINIGNENVDLNDASQDWYDDHLSQSWISSNYQGTILLDCLNGI